MLSTEDIPLFGAPFSWFIAGGWALDLYLGKQTRDHADLDLGIFRRDQHLLHRFLSEWTLSKVSDGISSVWRDGELLTLPVHEIQVTHPNRRSFEILLAEADETHWIYRRNQTVKQTLQQAVIILPTGIHILAPEIVLLFKSKNLRDHDQRDFETVRPVFKNAQVQWLVAALTCCYESHPWLKILQSS